MFTCKISSAQPFQYNIEKTHKQEGANIGSLNINFAFLRGDGAGDTLPKLVAGPVAIRILLSTLAHYYFFYHYFSIFPDPSSFDCNYTAEKSKYVFLPFFQLYHQTEKF